MGVFTRVNRFDYPIRGDQRRNISERSGVKTAFGFATRKSRMRRKGAVVACFVEWLGHGRAETGTVATTLP